MLVAEGREWGASGTVARYCSRSHWYIEAEPRELTRIAIEIEYGRLDLVPRPLVVRGGRWEQDLHPVLDLDEEAGHGFAVAAARFLLGHQPAPTQDDEVLLEVPIKRRKVGLSRCSQGMELLTPGGQFVHGDCRARVQPWE